MTEVIECLRVLLDEHGVKWDYGITGSTTTRFSINGIDLTFTPMRGGLVCSTILTPEQVIAVALCTGTCYMKYCPELSDEEFYPIEAYQCSICGNVTLEDKPKYCPNCGAKVIE